MSAWTRQNAQNVRYMMPTALVGLWEAPKGASVLSTADRQRSGHQSFNSRTIWRRRGDPCTDRKNRYEEALALTARETGKVGHHGWALATIRAGSSPNLISYTALRGRRCEWAVVVPSRLLPASEASPKKKETLYMNITSSTFREVVRTWEKSVGPITGMIAESLGSLVDEAQEHINALPSGAKGQNLTGDEWLIAAIRTAAESANGRFNVKYVQAIIDRWMREGFEAEFSSDNYEGNYKPKGFKDFWDD